LVVAAKGSFGKIASILNKVDLVISDAAGSA
jgi:hypothetical protein